MQPGWQLKMGWLAIADHKERRFSLRGVGHDREDRRRHPEENAYLLTRGSLTFETRTTADERPQKLLGYDYGWPDQRTLMFQAIPGGGISLVQVQGEDIAHAALQHSLPARTDILRVTFSWDAQNDWARLTIERPEEHQMTSVSIANVRPMALQDLRAMLMGHERGVLAKEIVFAALSDQIEPVGPMPSLSPNAPVATPQGYRALGDLKRGDTVYTRSGDIVPVLHRIDRTVPARGSFAPLRLRAPYFGLMQDLVVTPEQRLVIDGSEVEYLFAQEAVLTPARHLVNGFAALPELPGPTQRYSQLILPGHEAMILAGTALESLYIGRLRRKSDLLPATLLSPFDRSTLPEHGRTAFKVLKWFEAIHLTRQRAA